jgi:hypothetical protein
VQTFANLGRYAGGVVALYAATLLCSLYNFVGCGPLVIGVCRLVNQGICFREADLSVAPTTFTQLPIMLC